MYFYSCHMAVNWQFIFKHVKQLYLLLLLTNLKISVSSEQFDLFNCFGKWQAIIFVLLADKSDYNK